MANKEETLTDAIEKAVKVEDAKIPQDVSNVAPKQDQDEEEEEEKQPEPEPLEDEDAKQGRVLIQALRDPQRAAIVIDFLAKQAGYTKGELADATVKETKAAKSDITNILKEELGDEFAFLAPKFGKALTRYMSDIQVDDSRTQQLETRLNISERHAIESETTEAHNVIAQEWFGSNNMPDNVITAMSSAMDKFPPSNPNMSPTEYYNDIFTYVVGKLGLTKKEARSRITNNFNDVGARLENSRRRGAIPSENSGSPRKMALKDAVSLAIKQVDEAVSRSGKG